MKPAFAGHVGLAQYTVDVACTCNKPAQSRLISACTYYSAHMKLFVMLGAVSKPSSWDLVVPELRFSPRLPCNSPTLDRHSAVQQGHIACVLCRSHVLPVLHPCSLSTRSAGNARAGCPWPVSRRTCFHRVRPEIYAPQLLEGQRNHAYVSIIETCCTAIIHAARVRHLPVQTSTYGYRNTPRRVHAYIMPARLVH